jgi:hypothetical protein
MKVALEEKEEEEEEGGYIWRCAEILKELNLS